MGSHDNVGVVEPPYLIGQRASSIMHMNPMAQPSQLPPHVLFVHDVPGPCKPSARPKHQGGCHCRCPCWPCPCWHCVHHSQQSTRHQLQTKRGGVIHMGGWSGCIERRPWLPLYPGVVVLVGEYLGGGSDAGVVVPIHPFQRGYMVRVVTTVPMHPHVFVGKNTQH